MVSVLTREDSAPLRSRASRPLVCFFFFCFAGSAPLLPKPPFLRQLLLSFSLSVIFFVKQWQLQIPFSPCFGASFTSSSAWGRFSGAASDCGPASGGATGAAFGGGACLADAAFEDGEALGGDGITSGALPW